MDTLGLLWFRTCKNVAIYSANKRLFWTDLFYFPTHTVQIIDFKKILGLFTTVIVTALALDNLLNSITSPVKGSVQMIPLDQHVSKKVKGK